MISIIIPIRDRELSRLNKCVRNIKKNSKKLVKEIIVVDYGSQKPIKETKNYKVIRIEQSVWNKAHAMNKGILAATQPYVMTLDVDMIVSKEHFDQIRANLNPSNFIISTNVRRIINKDLDKDYDKMIENSTSWFPETRNQLFNQANGGFQVYHKDFFKKLGGIMEGMGKFHRAVDNWVFYMARMNNMNTVDISYPLLHLEHKKQKEDHYDKEIREQAEAYARYKAWYIDEMIKQKKNKNIDPFYGKDKPCDELFLKFLDEVSNRDKKIQNAVNNDEEYVTIAGQTFHINKAKKKVIICVIDNSGLLPDYFVWDLFRLYHSTLRHYDVEITQINACSIEHMRNLAAKYALGQNKEKKVYDYMVALDTDHFYNCDFINRFIPLMEQNNWPILTGLTAGKKPPYKNTQYLQWKLPLDCKGNTICMGKSKKIIEIGASGPVGMIINTKVFQKIPFPWYKMDYDKIKIDGVEQDKVLGSDLYFCKLLNKYKIPIRLDLFTSFPHVKEFCLNRGKILPKP